MNVHIGAGRHYVLRAVKDLDQKLGGGIVLYRTNADQAVLVAASPFCPPGQIQLLVDFLKNHMRAARVFVKVPFNLKFRLVGERLPKIGSVLALDLYGAKASGRRL